MLESQFQGEVGELWGGTKMPFSMETPKQGALPLRKLLRKLMARGGGGAAVKES